MPQIETQVETVYRVFKIQSLKINNQFCKKQSRDTIDTEFKLIFYGIYFFKIWSSSVRNFVTVLF